MIRHCGVTSGAATSYHLIVLSQILVASIFQEMIGWQGVIYRSWTSAITTRIDNGCRNSGVMLSIMVYVRLLARDVGSWRPAWLVRAELFYLFAAECMNSIMAMSWPKRLSVEDPRRLPRSELHQCSSDPEVAGQK